jgi:hypothetical protein
MMRTTGWRQYRTLARHSVGRQNRRLIGHSADRQLTATRFTLWRILEQLLMILLDLQGERSIHIVARRRQNRPAHSVARQNRSVMPHTVAHHHLMQAVHPVRNRT